jgi:hypothetical protein
MSCLSSISTRLRLRLNEKEPLKRANPDLLTYLQKLQATYFVPFKFQVRHFFHFDNAEKMPLQHNALFD